MAGTGAGYDSSGDEQVRRAVNKAVARSRASVPALSAFQQQMERYPALEGPEQAELLVRYRAGREATAALEALKPPTGAKAQAHRQELLRTVRDGQDALTALLGSMMRLVLLIARENAEDRYGRERANELMPDLVAEANLALTEAVVVYDESRCPSFAIYAGRVIRDRVRMVLARDSAVKLPPSWVRIKRIAAVRIPALTTDLGRPPTTAEIQADLLGRCLEWARGKLTLEQLELPEFEQHEVMLAKLRKQGMLSAIEQIDDVLIATQTIASLDAPVGEDGGSAMGDMLASPASSDTFDSVELDALRDALAQALASLTERERDITLHRFGFIDGETWTYQKISERYGVTAERIRQIERNVLTKLRSGGAGGTLGAFLDGGQ